MPAAAARVSVAASLLAGLLLGLSAPARSQAETDPEFSLCRRSFYRETPPQGPAGAGLIQSCHSLPGARHFASLYNSTCGASIYSAFCLSQESNWGEQQSERQTEDDGEGSRVESPLDSEVLIPALLGGGGGPSEGHNAANPAPPAWDVLISRLVREAAVLRCSDAGATEGADLFVLTGAAGLSEGEDGGCQVDMLWSAVCCASPEEGGGGGGGGGEESRGFSVGVVKGKGEEERVVSVQELGEVTGVAAVFTGFCGEAEGDEDVMALFVEKLEALRRDMQTTDTESEEGASENTEGEQAGGDTGSDDMPEVTEEEVMSASQREAQVNSVPLDDSDEPQDALEMENETHGSGSFVGGALMYVLSSSVSLLSAPLRPVVSTLTGLPGQVTYILGEDMAALSAVPSGTFSLFQNMVCDLWSGMWSATNLVAEVGELCFSGIYSCSSPLVGSLFGACQDGVTGVGQLAMDSVGIFGGVLDNVWSVFKFFGGTAWDHSEGYVGTVLSELGHQVKTVGLGLGTLVWRGGRGLGNVVGAVGGLAGGTVGSVVENVKNAFGGE
ncbi:endonuclease domain-containing 1 protein [Clupea harengus]|uniref:Endonuclease domain-containing 1 protein n=1 Tax=Clupea harengus TaxID=7950 RepID=A0A6P8GAR5_CLUHA|nr:endonuclease domain-containing 1 protein [Clupea harengus]